MSLIADINNANQVDFEHYFKSYNIVQGFIMEFGVASGGTINQIAKLLPDRTIYGFDSFEGLTEDWNVQKKGDFKVENPEDLKFESNVSIQKGYFNEKLPKFLKFNKWPKVALIHIDCDLYSSTKDIFNGLNDKFQNGSIIIFDEIRGYKGWEHHEYKAFNEFLEVSQYKHKCIGKHHSEGAGFVIWKDWDYVSQ